MKQPRRRLRPAKGRRPRPAKPAHSAQYRDLADYIAKTGDTQLNIAARVGTSQATVSKLVNGSRIPRSLLALRIAEYAHIPLDSFLRVHLAKRAEDAA